MLGYTLPKAVNFKKMEQNEQFQSILLGALFHDDKFKKDFWGLDTAGGKSLKGIKETGKEKEEEIKKIIELACGFQSCEGVGEHSSCDGSKRLVNLFQNISIKKDVPRQGKFFVPRQKLSYSSLDAIFDNLKAENNIQSDFVTEISGVGASLSFEAKFSRYAEIFKKYLWCEAVNSKDDVADISLWEHSALAAAIAACLWQYCQDHAGYLNRISENCVSPSEDGEKPFRLIVGDFSGIQQYIFELAKSKKAARRLKGRSFLVQMISEDIKRHILKELGLPPLNAIISAGGKFIILAPATDKT